MGVKYICSDKTCKVPILVCTACHTSGKAKEQAKSMLCFLCQTKHIGAAKKALPKVTLLQAQQGTKRTLSQKDSSKKGKIQKVAKPWREDPCTRLFVGNLPYTVTAQAIEASLLCKEGAVTSLQWLSDRKTGLFYGSCLVEMSNVKAAENAVTSAKLGTIKVVSSSTGRGK